MRYDIKPEKFTALLDESGLTEDQKSAFVLALADLLTPFVDAAWNDDGFTHMNAAQEREKAADSGQDVVTLSEHGQSKSTSARAAFELADGTV